MAVDCKFASKKLMMYGFGIPGQGFYAFDLPEAKGKINQATILITVLEGEANEQKLDQELVGAGPTGYLARKREDLV